MADEGLVVTELVAKLGIEPDASSFAAADKMLEGVAVIAAQLVVAVRSISFQLDMMAARAQVAGAAVQGALGVPAARGPSAKSAAAEAADLDRLARVDAGAEFFGPEAPKGFKPTKSREELVGDAKARINAAKETKEIEAQARREMGLAEEELSGMAKVTRTLGIAFAGAFAVNKVKDFAMGLVHAGSAVQGTAVRLGISAEAVQELGFAAKMSNTDIGALEAGLKNLQQNSAQAAKGSKTDAKAFKDLGISVQSLKDGEPIDALLEQVADSIAAMDTPAKQTAAAMQIFGRSGAQLLPFLKQGGAGIRALREEAVALGGGLSDSVIEEADEFEKSLTRLDFATLSLKSSIGNLLLPTLTHLVEWITKGVAAVKKLWTETKYLQTIMITALTYIAATNAKVVGQFILSWGKAALPFIGIAIAVAVLAAALEDIYQTLTGGRGMVGKWLDEWQGAGTVDNLVRNLAAGFASLNDALAQLSTFKGIVSFIGDARNALAGTNKKASLRGTREALEEGAKSKDPILAKIAQRDLAAFDAENFGDESVIQRATGRGLNAGVLKQEFGRASIGSNATGANRGATVNNVAVTVNAQTGADPKEIAAHAAKATKEALQKQNRNLREAHRGR